MGGGAEPGFCPKCSANIKAGETVCPNCGAEVNELSRTMTSGFPSSPGEDVWERFDPGKVFANRYTIIEEIGFGGMGRVYKAIDKYLGLVVALKIIRPEYSSNLRIIEHFKKETVLARSISSEFVVRVHDLGESEDTKYISMDYVEGQNLRDLLRASESLTIPTAVRFGKQICSALLAAHNAGVIHRDLKPSNIMIDKGGRIRVMDFGLAKTLDREEAHRAGAIVGTPAYMSPEQARGEKLDERTDIYALGLILYEMVTGYPVFEADSTTEYIKKHCSVDPEPPSRLNPSVPPALETLILKCLKKNREERYQKTEDVCRSLDLAVSQEHLKRKRTRSILLRSLLGIFALSAVALISYFLFFRGKAPPAESIRKSLAVMRFINDTGDPGQDYLRQLLQNLLIMDLEQSRYLRLVFKERLLNCLEDFHADDGQVLSSDVLDRIAARENVDFFLLGSFAATSQGYRLDIRVFSARRRETIGFQPFELALLNDIYDRCDEISVWTKSRLGLTRSELSKDYDEKLKSYTTASIDAMQLFFQGLEFYDKGDLKKSSECYQKAVALDENFAMAYARLGMNSVYLGQLEDARGYIQKAMSLRNDLTHRERLLIEGDFFNALENDSPRAIEVYTSLLLLYPDDKMALESLGAIYRNTEEWEKAAECFERLQEIKMSRTVVLNLAFIYKAKGQYEKASRIIRSNEDTLATSDEYHSNLAFCDFCQGNVNEAFRELGMALSQDPRQPRLVRLLGQLSLVKGHYSEAESAFRQLLESDREELDQSDGHFWLGHLYLLQGKYRDCFEQIQAGLDLARNGSLAYEEPTFLRFESYFNHLQGDFTKAYEAALMARQKAAEVHYKPDEISALQLMGLCQVELGRLAQAQDIAREMKEIIEKSGYRKLLRDCYYLEGMIALAKGSWDEATHQFSAAADLLPFQNFVPDRQAFYLEALANSLYQRGDLNSAQKQYEKVISLTTGFLMAGDAYARSLLQLGRICQINNDSERAREYLRKYLAVRAEADASLPEVEEARRLLASLS
jgi:serine/threonine protein kinase/tetratricopeptide (TPR) repeat protein